MSGMDMKAARYRSAVRSNRDRFDRMVHMAVAENDREAACAKIGNAARFAALCGTGFYASSVLEERLLGIAESIVYAGEGECLKPEGTLLVATELYAVGGHTKVLERIGEMLAEDGERVSLFITSPANKYIPDSLRTAAIESGGEVVEAKAGAYCERACRLRTYAGTFRRIVLMTHPEDVMPVLAFGTRRFQRPVFVYGHANHTFWLGVSIADCVLELNEWGRENDIAQRGIPAERIDVVGLPVAQTSVAPATTDRQSLSDRIGVPPCGSLVVTAASPRKFRTVGDLDFKVIAEGILSRSEDAVLVVIGPDVPGTPEWNDIRERYMGRFICTGPLKYPDLLACYAVAAVVVDSYPLNGWTSLMDAISIGAAVVCPQGSMGLMDYLVDSPAYAPDAAFAVEKILRLVASPAARRENAKEMHRRMINSTDYGVVKGRMLAAMSKVPGHSTYGFCEVPNVEPTIQDMTIYAMTVRRKTKFSIPGLAISSIREGTSKYHELSLFGGRFVWRF